MRIVLDTNVIVSGICFKLSADPDDDKFIECAVAGDASYIVSSDAHLLNDSVGSAQTRNS